MPARSPPASLSPDGFSARELTAFWTKSDKFAQFVLVHFKPWRVDMESLLCDDQTGSRFDSWSAALNAWGFESRVASDPLWFVDRVDGVPKHPVRTTVGPTFGPKTRPHDFALGPSSTWST